MVIFERAGWLWPWVVLDGQGERISIFALLLEVGKGVVHLSVLGFVCSDVLDQVIHGGIVAHVPVVFGDLGHGLLLQLWTNPELHVTDASSVGADGLLLQVSHKPVASLWGDQIYHEEGVSKEPLADPQQGPSEDCWFGHLQKGEQVHSLVERFVVQGVDEGHVSSEHPDGVQMAQEACDSARDSCDGL